jgi:hypothetical protein
MPLFEDLIEFIYKEEISERAKGANALLRLLSIADQFETPSCVRSCIELLEGHPMSLDFVLDCLSLPENVKKAPDVRPLVDRILALTGSTNDAFMQSEGVADLPFWVAKHFFEAEWGPGCEETLFACLLAWVRKSEETRPGWEVKTLLALIKFPFMDRIFLEKEVAAAPEMQNALGQYFVQKARAFQDSTNEERDAVLTSERMGLDPQLTRRACWTTAGAKPPTGEHVVDVDFSVGDAAYLELGSYITSRPIDICPEVSCWLALQRPHSKTWGPEAAEGTVGIRIRLQNPQKANAIVAATYVISFPTTEELTASSPKLNDVFQPEQRGLLYSKNVCCLRWSWKEFLCCDRPALANGVLSVRVTFSRLMVY